MSADTGLCALSHFYFYSRSGFQIILGYAETSGSYLYYRIGSVFVKVGVKSSLAGIIENTKLLRRPCKAFMSVVAD